MEVDHHIMRDRWEEDNHMVGVFYTLRIVLKKYMVVNMIIRV